MTTGKSPHRNDYTGMGRCTSPSMSKSGEVLRITWPGNAAPEYDALPIVISGRTHVKEDFLSTSKRYFKWLSHVVLLSCLDQNAFDGLTLL